VISGLLKFLMSLGQPNARVSISSETQAYARSDFTSYAHWGYASEGDWTIGKPVN